MDKTDKEIVHDLSSEELGRRLLHVSDTYDTLIDEKEIDLIEEAAQRLISSGGTQCLM